MFVMRDRLRFINVRADNIADFFSGISDLWLLRHKQKLDQEYWQWRYLDGPAEPSDLVVALRKDKVVGLYGLVYVPILLRGRRVLAGLMGSLVIDPAERSWQCYRGLVDRCISNGQQRMLAFRFGVSPLRMMQFSRNVGAKRVGLMSICFGLLDAGEFLQARGVPYPLSLLGRLIQPFIGLRDGSLMTAGLEVKEVQRFGPEFDRFWSEAARENYSGYYKDAAYMNWRYVKCPLRKYYKLAAYKNNELQGFIVFCLTGVRQSACVLDVMANRNDVQTVRILLLAACKRLRTERVGHIFAAFMPNTAALVVARSLGFHTGSVFLGSHQMVFYQTGDACSEQDFQMCDFSLGDWLAF